LFPDHRAIEQRFSSIDRLIADEGASVPCPFALEHDTNPFLLALIEPYRALLAKKYDVNAHDVVAIIAAVRAAKDNFSS
jgi:hypothetical protein